MESVNISGATEVHEDHHICKRMISLTPYQKRTTHTPWRDTGDYQTAL